MKTTIIIDESDTDIRITMVEDDFTSMELETSKGTDRSDRLINACLKYLQRQIAGMERTEQVTPGE